MAPEPRAGRDAAEIAWRCVPPVCRDPPEARSTQKGRSDGEIREQVAKSVDRLRLLADLCATIGNAEELRLLDVIRRASRPHSPPRSRL